MTVAAKADGMEEEEGRSGTKKLEYMRITPGSEVILIMLIRFEAVIKC